LHPSKEGHRAIANVINNLDLFTKEYK
jgi:hypothetical protein